MDYRVFLKKDSNGTFLATFPDLPWANTFGETKDEAIERSVDALLTGFEFLVRNKQAIPEPKAKGGTRVTVPAVVTAKLALHNLMVSAGVNKADLCKRLKLFPAQVDRLLDFSHQSKLDQLEAAFRCLGRTIELRVAPKARVA